MLEINGKYNSAKIYTDEVDEASIKQCIDILNQSFVKDAKVRFMPDIHAGSGCVIGTTIELKNAVCPNIIGVDIGCGVFVVPLGKYQIDPEKMYKAIQLADCETMESRLKEEIFNKLSLSRLKDRFFLLCKDELNLHEDETLKLWSQIGTLGGGNHFIEIDKDDDGNQYLVIHSGSRRFGAVVCKHFQKNAIELHTKQKVKDVIVKLKTEGREKEIEQTLKQLKVQHEASFVKDLASIPLDTDLFIRYRDAMHIAQQFAAYSRKFLAAKILWYYGVPNIELTCFMNSKESFQCVHNYIDFNDHVIRKGSIAAHENQKVIIPINMKDGCIIGKGKGNPEWNYSAPHGAGRIMSRSMAKELITLDEFKESMKGINSFTVNESTIDEAPMAYKSLESIVKNIEDTVKIEKIIKPIFNYKGTDVPFVKIKEAK